ncbi:MaoC family dehydratase [Congregibacter litoralis]|uniref:Acyl dehydratase n=1 Tax=Congregibacter litoralis KT71 TaxID=314285 RepID=A4A9X0_9GAMM|nr:MaoC family dehydratase [Congregibacter litoralis]EAQ97287.1 Acyl dehydratase [Congregibacter litoralis KT71]
MGVKVVPKEQLADQVGTKSSSDWVTMDQDRINTFADCTEDHQFIHIDEERAAQTPFGGTIAHGFLSLSMLPKLSEGTGVVPENVVMGINYGLNKVRFLHPVRAGKRIRAHNELINVEQKDDNRFLLTSSVTVEIEDVETPALVAESLAMIVCG